MFSYEGDRQSARPPPHPRSPSRSSSAPPTRSCRGARALHAAAAHPREEVAARRHITSAQIEMPPRATIAAGSIAISVGSTSSGRSAQRRHAGSRRRRRRVVRAVAAARGAAVTGAAAAAATVAATAWAAAAAAWARAAAAAAATATAAGASAGAARARAEAAARTRWRRRRWRRRRRRWRLRWVGVAAADGTAPQQLFDLRARVPPRGARACSRPRANGPTLDSGRPLRPCGFSCAHVAGRGPPVAHVSGSSSGAGVLLGIVVVRHRLGRRVEVRAARPIRVAASLQSSPSSQLTCLRESGPPSSQKPRSHTIRSRRCRRAAATAAAAAALRSARVAHHGGRGGFDNPPRSSTQRARGRARGRGSPARCSTARRAGGRNRARPWRCDVGAGRCKERLHSPDAPER